MDREEIDLKKLQELIKEIETKRSSRSLSDEYLSDHNCSTRDDVGIGEYAYGIVMIPEDWVLPYLKYSMKLNEYCLDYERDLSETELKLRKSEEIIDEMAKWLIGFTFSDKEEAEVIFCDKEQVKQYFEKKVEEK